VKLFKRLLFGKLTFINYRKQLKGAYSLNGFLPSISFFWGGEILHIAWRGYAISIDMRSDWKEG